MNPQSRSPTDFDRNLVAAKALNWFRSNLKNKTQWRDKDFLESAANYSICKSLRTYDPSKGLSPLSWCVAKLQWDMKTATRDKVRSLNSKQNGHKVIHLSHFESPEEIFGGASEDKDLNILHQDIGKVLSEIHCDSRIVDSILMLAEGESQADVARKLGLSESRVSQLVARARPVNEKKVAVFGEKDCARCKRTKPFTAFSKDKYTATGYRSYCKKCMAKPKKEKIDLGGKKICSRCQGLFTLDFFNVKVVRTRAKRAGKVLYKSQCKGCQSEENTRYYQMRKHSKKCWSCKKWRHFDSFDPTRKYKGTYKSTCRNCLSARSTRAVQS